MPLALLHDAAGRDFYGRKHKHGWWKKSSSRVHPACRRLPISLPSVTQSDAANSFPDRHPSDREAPRHRCHRESWLLSHGPGPEPDAAFRHAIDIARRQNTKSWELRASASLARLLSRQGKRNEARQALAGLFGWFTEGFDTRDLKEAKALLDELAS